MPANISEFHPTWVLYQAVGIVDTIQVNNQPFLGHQDGWHNVNKPLVAIVCAPESRNGFFVRIFFGFFVVSAYWLGCGGLCRTGVPVSKHDR